MAGPDLRHRMQQAVRGNARRNRSSRPPQENTALHPPVRWQSNFPNTLRLGDTHSLFSGTRGRPGSRRCWRSATHSSWPTALHAVDGVGVARHRGRRAGRGRPYPRRSPPPRLRCGRQPPAGAHRQCPRESLRMRNWGGGRKRGTIITPPRAAHVRSRAQHKTAKAAAIASLVSSLCWAGGKSRDRGSFACARRKLSTWNQSGCARGTSATFSGQTARRAPRGVRRPVPSRG